MNGARSGIFFSLPNIRRIPCAYIPFECKNYNTDVENPELDQLSGRFSTNRGMVGFLCCRHFDDRRRFIARCRDTFSDGRGLIIPFDDQTIRHVLDEIQHGNRSRIEDIINSLVDEVCL